LGQLQDTHRSLIDLGYQVVFVSPDQPSKLRSILEQKKQDYVLLSDRRAEASRAFGVAWRTGEELREKYKKYGIDLAEASGETHFILPVPSVFIFDKNATLRFTYVDPDHRRRIDPELLLAAAKSVK
jgi:peroxiredoxin